MNEKRRASQMKYYEENTEKIYERKRLYYWNKKFPFVLTKTHANLVAEKKKILCPLLKDISPDDIETLIEILENKFSAEA